jgi:hypothetical protein
MFLILIRDINVLVSLSPVFLRNTGSKSTRMGKKVTDTTYYREVMENSEI